MVKKEYMHELIEKFLATNTWSANTRDRYRRALRLFLDEVTNPAEIDAGGLLNWMASHPWGPSSQWIAMNAVKAFLRWRFGSTHPALDLKIKRPKTPPQRVLNMKQIKILLESFNTGEPKGIRDLAIAGLILDTGLRVSEVCRLEVNRLNYNPDIDTYMLQVIVKGGDWSVRSFSEYTAHWIESWIAVRRPIVEGHCPKDHGVLFVGVGGNKPGYPMTRHGLQCVIREWGASTGIGKLSPHDLRRSMASNATILGGPEDIVMKGGGWKSSDVFRRYTVGVSVANMKPYHPTTAIMEPRN